MGERSEGGKTIKKKQKQRNTSYRPPSDSFILPEPYAAHRSRRAADSRKQKAAPTNLYAWVSGILQELGPRNKNKANGTNQFSKLERAEKKSCKQRSNMSCFNNIDYFSLS